ncbi:MAG: hypothetical protein KKE20_02830 [Nanoarchaeota archaeon]|nr:hypothetical protein [Nanoarchaeota archaeon]
MNKKLLIAIIVLVVIILGSIGLYRYLEYRRGMSDVEYSLEELNALVVQGEIDKGLDVCNKMTTERSEVVCYFTYLGLKLGDVRKNYKDNYGENLSRNQTQMLGKEIAETIIDVCDILYDNPYAAEQCEQTKDQVIHQLIDDLG